MTRDEANALAALLAPIIEALLLTPAMPEVWAVLRPRRRRVVRLAAVARLRPAKRSGDRLTRI